MPWRTNDGRYVVGSYETWVDRQIRDAQERGDFDNLPGAGKPLDFEGKPHDPDWWVKRLIEREQLDMTGALPPQLALRKEAQTLRQRVVNAPTEHAARELAEDFNARVRELWRRPLEGPPIPVRPVDVEELVSRWHDHRAAPPPTGEAGPVPANTAGHQKPRPRSLSRVLARLKVAFRQPS